MRAPLYMALAALIVSCSSPEPVRYPVPTTPVSNLPTSTVPPQGPFKPNANLYVCNNIRISNRPAATPSGQIINYAAMVVANGVVLAAAPANDVCMTSGFGPRFGRMHKGIDLQSRPAGTIYSAGPGIIREVSVVSGFGNQVLIDHGNGVFTRYGHLASFAPGLAAGQRIGFGQPLGMMGQTGNATAVHVHYEILTGNYNTPKKSWGLTANNPLDFPAWAGLDTSS
ncbi:MAG: hypothetical protein Hens3KO_27770 [Henriciella sp.]